MLLLFGRRANGEPTPAEEKPDDRYFNAPCCRNCGKELTTPYCAHCGQKKPSRLGLPDLGAEAWDKIRWFEGEIVKGALKVSLRPGVVAREYVFGARKKNIHPLKLFLTGVVVLLLVLAQTSYLTSSSKTVSKALAMVQDYSKWSFSLGILAILTASLAVFSFRRAFNIVEHLVLATYTHFAVILANVINISPLIIWGGTEAVIAHRARSAFYMTWIEGLIVFVAFVQFFRIDLRRRWWLPLAAAVIFTLVKKGLVYLYARAVIRIVMSQLS
ncbi:DUF3667 domain-containing protein [Rhizobium sp. RU36D]|uniref:DUF3667 domain-containing protein n=1 Tax=Rhizobium sp. RU36D TaxID=1907415 RepID=UPI0009D874C0|nr:DUF3667 domain-containing protein [Rhizobium sp. RU36D]SMC92295.1 Protein of unknown function [Rhizobium sp. RU36D]